MSSLLSFFARRRTRLAVAALVTVALQLTILLLPGTAGARPILSAAALAIPCVVALLPAGQDADFRGYSFHRENVLGTSLDLYVSTASEDEARRCEAAVLDEIDWLEHVLSTRDPDSDISRLNRGDDATPSSELRDVLDLCEEWRQRSGGAFDPRIGELVQLWREAERTDTPPDAARLRALVGRRGEQPLDVDALGKAYILDRAARAAQAKTGVRGLLLDIGGDIVALSDCNDTPGKGWRVGVANPRRPEDNAPPLTRLRLRDQAAATSGAYERPVTIRGVTYSHILDPRNGRPADGVASATVVAPDGPCANALATALCVLTPEEGLRLVEATPDAECLLVAADGTEYRSSGLAEEFVAFADAEKWPDGHELTVAVTLVRPTTGRKIERPYVAVWIEDADGKPVRTLGVWGNNRKYLKDLSDWWKFAGKDPDLVRSVTKGTRAPGRYSLVWDGTDDKGKALQPGTYSVHIEVHREHGKHVHQTGKIECGDEKVSVTLDATAETGEAEVKYGPREKKK
jgi:thiamine biosynthesis lipoprotein ApbE